jgi:hypothetical protein
MFITTSKARQPDRVGRHGDVLALPNRDISGTDTGAPVSLPEAAAALTALERAFGKLPDSLKSAGLSSRPNCRGRFATSQG